MYWFGHEVPDHISGWATYQLHAALCDPIGDKEIPNVYVFSALAARSLSILFQQNRAPETKCCLKLCILDPLKKSGPTDFRNEVISAYQSSLCIAAGVVFLFCGTHNGKSASRIQSSTGTYLHIRMDGKLCVHPPLQNTASVGTKNQRQREHAYDVSPHVYHLSSIV